MIVTAIIITLSVLLAVILLCVAAIWLEKKFPGKRFDEMQTLSRLKGYRLAFWVGMLYYLVAIPLARNQTVDPYMLVFIGFLLQVTVAHTYDLLTHAALPLSDRPETAIGSYLLIGILQLLSFRSDLAKIQDLGMDVSLLIKENNFALWSNLVFGILFLYLGALHLIQALRKDGD